MPDKGWRPIWLDISFHPAAQCLQVLVVGPQEVDLFGRGPHRVLRDAVATLRARGIRLDRKDVHIAEPIREVGTYTITVDVHDGVTADVKTIVTAKE